MTPEKPTSPSPPELFNPWEKTEIIREVVARSGLISDERHFFRISPDCPRLSIETIQKALELRGALGNFFACLADLSRMTELRVIPRETREIISTALLRPLSRPDRRIARNVRQIPLMFRVDAMIDTQGDLFIAEIEGDKKHGFGFAALTKDMATKSGNENGRDKKFLPGVVPLLEKLMNEFPQPIAIIIGDLERFYRPEMEFLRQKLDERGIQINVLSPSEIEITPSGEVRHLNSGVRIPAFVDIPNMTDRNKENLLKLLWEKSELKCLIPPAPMFGLKSALALLFNEKTKSFFCGSELNCEPLIARVPETHLLAGKPDAIPEGFVLKRTSGSGTSGVALGSSSAKDKALWQKALNDEDIFVIQRRIPQKLFTINREELKCPQALVMTEQFLRLALFFVVVGGRVRLADISGTARETPDVHGSRDSVLLPIGVN